jgi:hypothetical protein
MCLNNTCIYWKVLYKYMKVVYTAPKRAHHYLYAKVMVEAGILQKIDFGLSRISPRKALPELGNKLYWATSCRSYTC